MTIKPMTTFASVAALAIAATIPLSGAAQAEYPERPITMYVAWGAGGGTDAVARILGSLLEGELGQPVNVVNRTGGSGVVGHSAMVEAEPDGYELGLATGEIGMMHWQGLTELTWEDFTPIALVNEDAAAVQVRTDAPWDNINELLDEIRESEPGTFQATGTGQGGIWHLAIAGMLYDLDIDPAKVPWVPSEGAAPGLQDLVAGGVDIAPVSLVEARSLIEAGRVKSLALMAPERVAMFPDLPTLEEETGSTWSAAAWRGVVGPKGLPDDVVETLTEAVENVYNSDEFQEFMEAQGFGMVWASGDDFANYMDNSNQSLGEVMRAVGIAE